MLPRIPEEDEIRRFAGKSKQGIQTVCVQALQLVIENVVEDALIGVGIIHFAIRFRGFCGVRSLHSPQRIRPRRVNGLTVGVTPQNRPIAVQIDPRLKAQLHRRRITVQ